jgi:beta-phosphoglucomutase
VTSLEVRALLFDLDGTLVDTHEANYLAYRDAFRRSGYELTREDFAPTWGQDSRDFIPRLIPGIPASQVSVIRSDKAVAYTDYLDVTVPNLPLIGFLRATRAVQRSALVTTAKADNGTAILERHGLTELFDVTVFGDELENSKPHPEAYAKALDRLGVAAEDSLAFEDSEAGAASARAAGIRVMRVGAFT